MLGLAPDYDMLTVIGKVEVFEHALDTTSGDDLHQVMWLKSRSSEVYPPPPRCLSSPCPASFAAHELAVFLSPYLRVDANARVSGCAHTWLCVQWKNVHLF